MGITVFTGFFCTFGAVDVSGLVKCCLFKNFILRRLEVWGKEKRCSFFFIILCCRGQFVATKQDNEIIL